MVFSIVEGAVQPVPSEYGVLQQQIASTHDAVIVELFRRAKQETDKAKELAQKDTPDSHQHSTGAD